MQFIMQLSEIFYGQSKQQVFGGRKLNPGPIVQFYEDGCTVTKLPIVKDNAWDLHFSDSFQVRIELKFSYLTCYLLQ